MTNKEALQALLDGKKLRKSFWQETIYIYFDPEKDRILFDDGNYAQMPITNEFEYEEYEEYEELLNDEEKEYLRNLVSVYYRGLKKDIVIQRVENSHSDELIIGYMMSNKIDVCKLVSIQILPMKFSYMFTKLKNLKCYTLKELGIDD